MDANKPLTHMKNNTAIAAARELYPKVATPDGFAPIALGRDYCGGRFWLWADGDVSTDVEIIANVAECLRCGGSGILDRGGALYKACIFCDGTGSTVPS